MEWFSGNRELIAEGNHSIGAAVANMFFFFAREIEETSAVTFFSSSMNCNDDCVGIYCSRT